MRSFVPAILVVCVTLSFVGCGCGDDEETTLDTTTRAEDEPQTTAGSPSQDRDDEDNRRNPVMYGPHLEIIAVLMETEPWLTVIGSETPSVAVYADGTVVYRATLPDESRWEYLEAKLTKTELESLRKKLGPSEEFMALESFIDLVPDATDMPRTKIYLFDGTQTKAVSIRAYSSRARRAEIEEQWPDVTWPELYEQLGEFDRVYGILTGMQGADAQEWRPPYIELYVYGSWSLDEWRKRYEQHDGFPPTEPYSDPPPWPQDWPTFDDPLAWDWGDSSYSLYLPGSSLDEVRRFFASPSAGSAVLIEGRVCCVTYRYAFPGEGTYRDAFDEAEKDDNPHRLGLWPSPRSPAILPRTHHTHTEHTPMADARIEQLADILVDYSTKITKGDEVQLLTTAPVGLPLFRAVYRRVIERGAHVYTHIGFEDQMELFYKSASEAQLKWFPELLYEETKRATAYIRVDGGLNSRTLAAIDPAKTTMWHKTIEPIFGERINNTRWVCTRAPNEGGALEAGMSLSDYEDFYYGACLLDWNEEAKKMRRIADLLDAAKIIRVVAKDTDLTVSVAGRPAVPCCGQHNMPDGEIYLAPLETETHGHIRFTFPARAGGNDVEDIFLKFAGGRVVEATAEKGQDKLDKELATDDDAKLIGEFAFGVNYSIKKFTNCMLFDEKIGGTMHIALGRAYDDSGGLSKSAIHWDIVKDLRDDGQVFADGTLVFESGKWLVG